MRRPSTCSLHRALRAPAVPVVAALILGLAAIGAREASAQGGRPTLTLPEGVEAVPGGVVAVDVVFDGGGAAVSSIVFSLDYDERWLSFDPTDSDADGVPDRAELHIPRSFAGSVMVDPGDLDGEIDVFVSALLPPLDTVPDGPLVTLTFDVGTPQRDLLAEIRFSDEPAPSFGDDHGAAVAGDARDGSVHILAMQTPVLLPYLNRP